jgi:MarR-like DNA-binding transcriptional regulator SgrR of sgrS sRNA
MRDPVLTTLHHSTYLYINNEIINNNLNKNDLIIKSKYQLKNQSIKRNTDGSYKDQLPPKPHSKLTKSNQNHLPRKNVLVSTVSTKTTTTTTTTTNRITSNSVSNIKPTIVFSHKKDNQDMKKVDFMNGESNFQNKKRYARFGRDISENLIENFQLNQKSESFEDYNVGLKIYP